MLDRHTRSATNVRVRIGTLLVGVLMALVAFSSAAFAQEEGYSNNQPDTEVRFGNPNRPTLQEDSGLLPFTGADLTLFAVTGLAAIGTGVVVLRRTRPREE